MDRMDGSVDQVLLTGGQRRHCADDDQVVGSDVLGWSTSIQETNVFAGVAAVNKTTVVGWVAGVDEASVWRSGVTTRRWRAEARHSQTVESFRQTRYLLHGQRHFVERVQDQPGHGHLRPGLWTFLV